MRQMCVGELDNSSVSLCNYLHAFNTFRNPVDDASNTSGHLLLKEHLLKSSCLQQGFSSITSKL